MNISALRQYRWQGLDSSNNLQKGLCQAPNKRLARALLTERGLVVRKIRLDTQTGITTGRISKLALLAWIQQLCSLLTAGIALYEAIALSGKSQSCAKMHKLIQHLLSVMEAGQAFSQALTQSAFTLPSILIRMIVIGERTGKLAQSLHMLSQFWQTQEAHRKTLQKAARYPFIVLLCACLISLGMLLYLVPQFAKFYAEQQASLPTLTLWVMALSNLLLHHGALGLMFIFCTGFGMHYAYRHSRLTQRVVAKCLLGLPSIGCLYQARLCSDWAQAMAMMLAAGINLRDALSHTLEQNQNPLLCEALTSLLTCIEGGQSLYHGLQQYPLFPEFARDFLRVGEETGDMLPVLQYVHTHYSGLITNRIEQISSYIEPAFMLFTGIIIGTVVLALYLPIFSMGAAL